MQKRIKTRIEILLYSETSIESLMKAAITRHGHVTFLHVVENQNAVDNRYDWAIILLVEIGKGEKTIASVLLCYIVATMNEFYHR